MEVDYDGIVVAGSSTKGFCALGCIDKNKDFLTRVKYYSGTSSGSIIICLLAAGYEPVDIFNAWEDDKNPFGHIDISEYSFFNMEKLMENIRVLLEKRGIVYFGDYQKEVYVCATEFDGIPKAHYFSKAETPTVKVIDAIKASCAIPGLFPPVFIDSKMYVDGALKDNFPVDVIHFDSYNILGINIIPETRRPENMIEMVLKAVHALIGNTVNKEKIGKCRGYIEIEVEEHLKSINLYFKGRSY